MGSDLTLGIRKLTSGDAAVVAGFIAVCGEHIHRTEARDHWYPIDRLDPVVDRFSGAELWGVEAGDLLVGVFSLSAEPLPYYDPSSFGIPAKAPCYLSALAVLPSHQRCGVGRFAMEAAETAIVSLGGDAIRFDAVTTNAPAVAFYRHLGYTEGSVIPVGRLSVVCFERALGATVQT